MISPDLIVSMPHGGQRPIIVRGTMISVADARHLAIKQLRTAYTKYHVGASSKVSTIFHVFRSRRGIAAISTHSAVSVVYENIVRVTPWVKYGQDTNRRTHHDDENSARRRSSTRSFPLLLSTFIGSDKPCKSVRGGSRLWKNITINHTRISNLKWRLTRTVHELQYSF